jgi:glycerol-3-phosphate acyltransferase PlsY
MKWSTIVLALLGLSLCLAAVVPVSAHRPYFEEEDIGPEAPWQVTEPTISTAIYATLESAADVDYFAFEGQAGEVVLLALTIPQIEGQEEFAPTLALMGPGLPQGDVADRVVRPGGAGVMEIAPSPGLPPTFFEPFSRTSYWDRQEERVTLPADGRYVVAVWHPQGRLGRYVFVIGDKERLGGDPAFPVKMRGYWTPVGAPASERASGAASGTAVLLWALLGLLLGSVPSAYWLGSLVLRTDIRQYGDGNPGAANAWRAGGWRAGVPAVLLDYLKGVLPVGLAQVFGAISGWGLVPVALAPVLGHAFSPFLRLRGGKALAVTFGVWTALMLWEGPTVLGVSLGICSLVQAADGWSVILALVALAGYLLLSQAGASTMVIWAGNLIIVAWRRRPDLRHRIRPRPWVSKLLGRPSGTRSS